MFNWVLMTVFLAAPGMPPPPELPGAAFNDKTACEMQAARHNLTSARSYQRCVAKLGDRVMTGAYLPSDAMLAAYTPPREAPPARPAQPAIAAAPAPLAVPVAPAAASHAGVQYASLAPAGAGPEQVAALPQANCNGTPTGLPPYYVVRAAWTPGVNGCDPGERVDRTTADDARRLIAAAGYSRARDLRKGCDSVWHAKVDRGICYINVAVSPQGQVIQETD